MRQEGDIPMDGLFFVYLMAEILWWPKKKKNLGIQILQNFMTKLSKDIPHELSLAIIDYSNGRRKSDMAHKYTHLVLLWLSNGFPL